MKRKWFPICALVGWILLASGLALAAGGGDGGGGDCSCSCGGIPLLGGGCTASGQCPCTCDCGVFSDSCTCGAVNIADPPV